MIQVTPENFPDLLRRIRKEKGWSAREFAEQLGISQRTVEGWEQGRFPKKIIPLINFLLTKNAKPL
jgi:transcriptional regulator with XRE-family HTH domain